MALPVSTDSTMLPLDGIKQTVSFGMDLPARDGLKCAAQLNLGGNIDEAFARAFLQARANKLTKRFLTGGEHEHGSVRRLAQMPGRCGAWGLGAAGHLVDNLFSDARIGERDLVERQPKVGTGKRERIETRLGAAP